VVIAVKPVQHGVFAEKGQGGNLCDRMSGGGEEHHLGPGAEIGIVGGAILLVEGNLFMLAQRSDKSGGRHGKSPGWVGYQIVSSMPCLSLFRITFVAIFRVAVPAAMFQPPEV
jgi:hypothetical protein